MMAGSRVAGTTCRSTCAPILMDSRLLMPSMATLRSSASGWVISRWLKTSSWRVSAAARCAAACICSAPVRGLVGHEPGVAQDRRQQVIEVMGDTARQPAQGFEALS